MSDLYWLSKNQLAKIERYFPLAHSVPRVDDLRVVSGIIFVIRNDLRWRDAPADYGPHKTLYNRFVRWTRLGVFDNIYSALSAQYGFVAWKELGCNLPYIPRFICRLRVIRPSGWCMALPWLSADNFKYSPISRLSFLN